MFGIVYEYNKVSNTLSMIVSPSIRLLFSQKCDGIK